MRAFYLSLVFLIGAVPAWANARISVLMDVMQVAEVAGILREEGLAYAQSLDADMLDGQGGAFWSTQASRIYDAERIMETIRVALENGLDAAEVDAAVAFFGSESGTRIIRLENAARRAMSTPEIEEAARDLYAERDESDDPLMNLVARYIGENDLLERNVTGAMTANYQFHKGLSDGDYLRRSEEEILNEIWAQQEDIRADTDGWLNGFLLMAYQPLEVEVLQNYVNYSSSGEGRALNAALFKGFEVVYRDISYALGRAIALSAQADEI